MKQLKATLIKKFIRPIKPSKEVIAFCDALRAIGVDAKLISEPMDLSGVIRFVDIKGMVEIQQESPIRWVIPWLDLDPDLETIASSTAGISYIVPDSKLYKHMKKIKIRMIKHKNIPIIGKVKYVYWKGKDSDRRVIDSLNNDHDLINRLMQVELTGKNLWISSHYSSGGSGRFNFPKMPSCWEIQNSDVYGSGFDHPSNEEWSCYQLIAQHLLGERTIDSRLITKERKQANKAIRFNKLLRGLFILLFISFLFFVFFWWVGPTPPELF